MKAFKGMAALRAGLVGGVVATALLSVSADAQESGNGVGKEGANEAEVSTDTAEIIVTAQHRSERLQDVPVAVTAVSGDTISASNYTSLSDLRYLAPGLEFNTYQGPSFTIRGVGTQSYDYGSDQTVGIVIDGVVQGIPRDPALNNLVDIERVEVLRGPQGTLFGKNTSAGVVSITTKAPSFDDLTLDAHYSYGTGNEVGAQAVLNLPLGSRAAVRVSGYVQHLDGFVHNALTGKAMGGHDREGARAKLLWQATDRLKLQLIGSFDHNRDTRAVATFRSYGPGPDDLTGYYVPNGLPILPPADQNAPFNITPGPRNETVADASRAGNHFNVHALSLQADYELGDHVLTAISAYRRFEGDGQAMSDQIAANQLDNNSQTQVAEQITQELRLASPTGERLEYVLGGYFYDLSIDATQVQAGTFGLPNFRDFGLPFGPVYSQFGGEATYRNRSRSYAAFAHASFRLDESFRLIGGLRYTDAKVSSSYATRVVPDISPFPGLAPLPPGAGGIRRDNLSYLVGGQFFLTRDIMAYATYSTGFKGPTISNLQGEARSVLPEKSRDYQIGLKATLLDRRLTMNLALFDERYRNFQAQIYDNETIPAQFILGNAGALRSRGVEAELAARPISGLRLSGSLTYADARYRDFLGQCYTGQPISPVAGEGCYLDAVTGSYVANLAGLRLNAAPKLSFNLAADYAANVGRSLEADAGVSYSWRSDAYTVAGDPNTIIGSYGLLNAHIGVSGDDGRWRLGLIARNLLDTHYVNGIVASFFYPGAYAQLPAFGSRRSVGVTLDLKLGAR